MSEDEKASWASLLYTAANLELHLLKGKKKPKS